MIITDQNLKLALSKAIEQSVSTKEGKQDKVRKFDETLDLIINLRDLDIRNPNNRIEQEIMLPHAIRTGKMNVCFIADGDMIIQVKEKKYDVIDSQFLEEIDKKDAKTKKRFVKKYDDFVCQAPIMRNLAKVLGRQMGQAGKMPKPQPKGFGIIKPDDNVDRILATQSKRVSILTKKAPMIQTIFGKKNLSAEKNIENLKAILGLVESKLPNGIGNIKSVYIKTTMGKPAKVAEPATKGSAKGKKGGKK